MTSIIRWEEPPASTSGRKGSTDRQRAVEVLKQNPGKWALVAEAVNGSAVSAWKRLGCEAVGRRTAAGKDPKRADIYARWPNNPAKVEKDSTTAQARKAELREAVSVSNARTAAPAAASHPPAKPARASLPISTAPKTLDLENPADAALLRQRQKFEADRQARLRKGGSR